MHTVLDCLNTGLPFSHKMTLKVGKCMEIGWRQIQRVGRMREYVPQKIVEENLCETRIIMQKNNSFAQFPSLFVLDCSAQFESVSQYTSALTIQPGGRYSSSKTLFESQNNANMTLPAEFTCLNFFGAFYSFLNPWHRMLLGLRLEMMDHSLVSCDYVWQELLSLLMVPRKEC